MPADLVLDLPGPPDRALARLAGSINERPQRAFGVLKTRKEFVGAVVTDRFEVWERGQRAIHAVGSVRARRGGTRVEARFRLSPFARLLLVLFAALYAVVAVGIASQPPEPSITASEVVIAAVGAAVIAALFYGASVRQRRDLADFLAATLSAPAAKS